MRKDSSIPYVYQKRGVYYFSRRVPKDLFEFHKRPNVTLSLKTKSSRVAKAKSATLAAQLDEQWLTLRWRQNDNPLSRFLVDQALDTSRASNAPLLSEAKGIYLTAKAITRPVTFEQSVERAIGVLSNVAGDKPLDKYTRQDANNLRDTLFKRNLSKQSVSRMISVIRAVINFASKEQGIQTNMAFSGVYLGEDDADTKIKRHPVPLSDIKSVQRECRLLDDEGRWLISLISDTGMRLSEAAGLHKDDIELANERPHIILKAHSWRRLKTNGSERIVPLAGEALWAIKQAINASETEILFPRYCDYDRCKSNSASAALNKWLSPRVPDGCVIHSFRHSFRDRLRAVECPKDIVDRLGGWSVAGVGETYGAGYPIDVLHKWVEKAVLQ